MVPVTSEIKRYTGIPIERFAILIKLELENLIRISSAPIPLLTLDPLLVVPILIFCNLQARPLFPPI